MRVKIEGTQYSRDLTNMAVLCSDHSVKNEYEIELAKHHENLRRDKEINKLKTELSEIKSMLRTLIDRGSNG
jgi:hypothetical protein